MYETQPTPMPAPRRSKAGRNIAIIGAVLGSLVLLVLCMGVLGGCKAKTGSPFRHTVLTPSPKAAAAGDGIAPVDAPTSKNLLPSDVTLGVKITSKECYGSAGCNVEYRITTAVDDGVRASLAAGGKTYDLTYEVSGFEDGPQIGTMTIDPDGTTHQDGFQFGQTARQSTKLKVKVTDVEAQL